MTLLRFHQITRRYPSLRIAVVGDLCLDRYLEIDPGKAEVSIETGLPVYNVTRVRSQAGGAGTIINNLVALGVGEIIPVAFCGEDGEGWELQQALRRLARINLKHLLVTPQRRTFTYAKPLLMPVPKLVRSKPGRGGKSDRDVPQELNRLDSKNWSPTPRVVEDRLIRSIRALARQVDALLLLDQVDVPETGVLTRRVLAAIGELAVQRDLLILGDSRRGVHHFPPVACKVNAAELQRSMGDPGLSAIKPVQQAARVMAGRTGKPVFVTLARRGMVGADATGAVEHVAAVPVRGPIDIVGAGDAVTANLATALLGGASLREALELANAAASVVIHQLGTTGTATRAQLRALV